MGIKKTPATNDYWAEFVAANGTIDRDYTVVVFGDGSEPWDELVELVGIVRLNRLEPGRGIP